MAEIRNINGEQISEKELDAAQKEAEKESGSVFTYEFKKPLSYNGIEYKELHFDFDSLTGRDSLEVEAEMRRTGKGNVIVGALNSDYIIRIAARACTEPIGTDAFENMRLFDFNKIRDRTRSFLLISEQ